ncbi:hypothetical protein CAMRE0001_1324 [Campylobacter rectus RM3267]|uniref:Uncharacterized protein n=1 Tax=Campylobacter rectus RM3267 TaxID=553218 RepID=B9D015_CAMRE|nr:hypothetical protein CAMRE0001_1324 [Campylobacter rectus RM3267]
MEFETPQHIKTIFFAFRLKFTPLEFETKSSLNQPNIKRS